MELRVKLMPKDIFMFSMYHFYQTIPGIISVACTILVLGVVAASWSAQPGVFRAIMLIGVVFVMVSQPFLIYQKAVRQTKDPQAGKEIYYKLDYNGIRVQQGKEKGTVSWSQVVKVRKIPGTFVVYLNRSRAYLFPYWALTGDKKTQFTSAINQYVSKEKRRGI
ncbi:MAG: YcxB family protein [Clostridium sp.]